MKREGFIFYQSFLEAGKNLPEQFRLGFYERVLNYGVSGENDTSGDGIIEAMFSLVKPQIDANNERFENGKKGAEYGKLGGRPQKPQSNPTETPDKPQSNPTETPDKPQNNPKITPQKPQNNPTETPKEKEKDKDKEKENNNTAVAVSDLEYPLKKFHEEALEVSIEDRNVTQHMAVCFFDLGYVPAKYETVESLRKWIMDIAKLKVKTAEQMLDTIISWHTYWKGNKKPVKNHKSSLLNHYSLKPGK